MEKVLRCPICQKRFNSRKMILVHIIRHHPIGGSAAAPVDLLPWPIKTRRRGSNRMVPPPTPPRNENRMDLVLYDENRALDLPLRKRLTFIRAVARIRNHYICHICGRVYTDGRALGGHKAQHTLADRRREKQMAAGALVMYEPQRRPAGPHQCGRCRTQTVLQGGAASSGEGHSE